MSKEAKRGNGDRAAQELIRKRRHNLFKRLKEFNDRYEIDIWLTMRMPSGRIYTFATNPGEPAPSDEELYPDYQSNSDDYGSDVTAGGSQLATYETIDEIKLCLKNLENARVVDLSAAHKALLDSITTEAYDQGLATLDSINNDIKAGFQLVNERLKWTPAQGVKTQLDQQWRNFRDEVEQYLKATSMFERRLRQQGEKYDQTNSDEQPSLGEQERVDGPLRAPLNFQTLSKKSMKQTRNHNTSTLSCHQAD
ncbi:hypothetical protein BJX99DRAFT_265614 [Aspergillus californicus]